MTFIKDPETIPQEFLDIPEVKEAMDELTYMSSDPETRAVYDARVRELNDIYSGQTTRYKDGLAEGIEKGRAEERAKAEKELAEQKAKAEAKEMSTVKNLLKLGLSLEQISSATGLSVANIESLTK